MILQQDWEFVMVQNLGSIELVTLLVVMAITALAVIWPAARICRKAGYSPALGILAVVPLANIVLLWFLGFAEWPSRRAG
jgi:hypothetical protein